MTTHDASKKNEIRTCDNCGKRGHVAIDETDAGHDEMAVDSRGLVSRGEYVCGACLESAENEQEAE